MKKIEYKIRNLTKKEREILYSLGVAIDSTTNKMLVIENTLAIPLVYLKKSKRWIRYKRDESKYPCIDIDNSLIFKTITKLYQTGEFNELSCLLFNLVKRYDLKFKEDYL